MEEIDITFLEIRIFSVNDWWCERDTRSKRLKVERNRKIGMFEKKKKKESEWKLAARLKI